MQLLPSTLTRLWLVAVDTHVIITVCEARAVDCFEVQSLFTSMIHNLQTHLNELQS